MTFEGDNLILMAFIALNGFSLDVTSFMLSPGRTGAITVHFPVLMAVCNFVFSR